ncbi:hypothetical protein Acr_10g0009970 [Actinidia rufa]|uniref:Uncharacterized protein n=1 Tax=Actinidia rufa TaxID=165716 RepID=A0A7J0FA77_9ERIC|nr:hypothetical protein Acr_10g0009970 [Actinidia rufa]
MHLRSRLFPKKSTSNPLDNRARPTTNTSQALDLEGIHREMHGIAEQIRIMNEINAHLCWSGTFSKEPQHQSASLHSRCKRSPSISESQSSSRTKDMTGEETRMRMRSPPRDDRVHKRRGKSIMQKLKDLDAWIDVINTGVNASVTVDTLIRQTELPFIERLMKVKVVLKMEDPSDKMVIVAMMKDLRPGPPFDSLSKSIPEILLALQCKIDKYIASEELKESKRKRRGKDDHKRKESDTRRMDYRGELKIKRSK